MIGISFYLNDPLAEERIIQASRMGVKRGFTSLHIPEEAGELAVQAKNLLTLAREKGIDVYADVSLKTPDHLGIGSLFHLKEMGVTGLRLDDFFDHDFIVSLAKEFKIAVNSSILFEPDLQILLNNGLGSEQLIGWHNFYPRRETGLSESFFRQQNELFKRYGIPIFAFVTGAGEKRGPLFEGLPTLEQHRDKDPFIAALELYKEGTDVVFVGDPEPGEELLKRLVDYNSGKIVIKTGQGFRNHGEYRLRPDVSRDVLRLMDTRVTESVPPVHNDPRPKGSITIDNDLYGRYRGEMQIALTDLPADERVNVIGTVNTSDLPLLEHVKSGMIIEFI